MGELFIAVFKDDNRKDNFIAKGIETQEDKAGRLHVTFNQQYKGNCANDMIEALRGSYEPQYDKDEHYGKAIAIVQSKAVYEISKVSHCWPPRDKPLVDFYESRMIVGGKYEAEELAAVFYSNILSSLRDHFDMDALTPGECMAKWAITDSNLSSNLRHKIFEGAMKHAMTVLDRDIRLLEEDRPTLPPVPSSLSQSQDKEHNALVGRHVQDWHHRLFERYVEMPRKELGSKIKEWYGRHRTDTVPFFIIAFDECADVNRRPMKLIALQRIIKAADAFEEPSGVKFWHFLLDTTSSIVGLVHGSGESAPSYRLRGDYRPPSVWSYMSFDLNKPPIPATAEEGLKLTYLALYGRPLWQTVANDLDLPNAAVIKLLDAESINKFHPTSESHVFAVFSHRVLLELAGQSEASSLLAMASVHRHMRLLMDVLDRNMIVTKSPSEPILSIAAALALNRSKETYAKALATLVDSPVIEGTIRDVGNLGELSSRVLFTLTRDFACYEDEGNSLWMPKPIFLFNKSVRVVTLKKFMETMLGKSLGISQRMNVTWDNFLDWADKVYINFTHFTDVNENISAVSEDFLADLWLRTSAAQCAFNQPVMDGFIVGYCGKLDGSFDKAKLLIILWQTKIRLAAAKSTTPPTLVSPYIVKSDGQKYKPVHLAIFLDLMSTAKFQEKDLSFVHITYERAEPIPHSKTKEPTWGGFARPADEAARYLINIRGHSSDRYPVLLGFEHSFDRLFDRLGACVTMNQKYRQCWDNATTPSQPY